MPIELNLSRLTILLNCYKKRNKGTGLCALPFTNDKNNLVILEELGYIDRLDIEDHSICDPRDKGVVSATFVITNKGKSTIKRAVEAVNTKR